MSATNILPVAIVQAAPIPLAIGDGLLELTRRAGEAIADGARLMAFGESMIGGYPLWLDAAPGAALWDHPGTKALHRILLDQALVAGDARLAPLQELVDRRDALVSFGAHERVRSSLFNTQFLMRPCAPPLLHRKLVPTHGERLIWARGDGSTLDTHVAPWGRVGSLICWEHWMPLVRAAMHHSGETVHVAAWPTVRESYRLASRHYAFEGRCFVLAAGTIQSRDDHLAGLERAGGDPAARDLLMQMPDGPLQHGGSAIIDPNAAVLAEAGGEETVLHATLNLDRVGEALAALDTDGHYSRPDVFELMVDRRPLSGVTDRTSDAGT